MTEGADVETAGLDVDEVSGRVVVERLTDGSVGRLEPDPPQPATAERGEGSPDHGERTTATGFQAGAGAACRSIRSHRHLSRLARPAPHQIS